MNSSQGKTQKAVIAALMRRLAGMYHIDKKIEDNGSSRYKSA
ncbi:invertase [Neisseria cinerea]|nr:invertase [Neisseria cinerea]